MPEKEFDAIIIGSGIGGLSCAASLAMCDYKVLVLEKNHVLGGSLSSYTDSERGNWIWSPGVQWVCDYSGNSVDYKLLKAITGGKVSFSPLDDECQIKYFTGEDIFAQGLTPLNGVITASVVTGKNLIRRFKKQYNTVWS